MADDFRPALIVVDFQEDFCPPNGSLAVAGGRDIAPVVNDLLSLPFVFKAATKDWHPPSHVSFASNHDGAEPFASTTTIENPHDPAETCTARLWPVHCVQGTPGAALVPVLDAARVDAVVEKGTDERVEMYSAFYDPFYFGGVGAGTRGGRRPVCDSGLAAMLHERRATHVFVVGLAADYCVRFTAADAAREGFETVIVAEGTRAVDSTAWERMAGQLERDSVRVVPMDGEEVARVRALGRVRGG